MQVDVFNGKHDRYAVIEASAGTGKTFALVELVLELVLEQEIPLKSILLVTFTEKATAELRLRLRTKLWELLEFLHFSFALTLFFSPGDPKLRIS